MELRKMEQRKTVKRNNFIISNLNLNLNSFFIITFKMNFNQFLNEKTKRDD